MTDQSANRVVINIDVSEANEAMTHWLRRAIRASAARQRQYRRDPFARFARWLGRRLVAWGTRP